MALINWLSFYIAIFGVAMFAVGEQPLYFFLLSGAIFFSSALFRAYRQDNIFIIYESLLELLGFFAVIVGAGLVFVGLPLVLMFKVQVAAAVGLLFAIVTTYHDDRNQSALRRVGEGVARGCLIGIIFWFLAVCLSGLLEL